MSKYLAISILILLTSRLFGQLQIDAGNDTIICVGAWGVDTTEIGGNPTAFGGVEPYIYSWSTNYTIGSNYFGASYFLDDSTISNPNIINDAPTNLTFKLIVTDNSGAQAEDSIRIRFSSFAYIDWECFAVINQGDTAILNSTIGLGIEPLTFFWSPSYNISDTSIHNPKVWPDTSLYYYVYAIDSIGCKSETSSCWISVNTTAINSIYLDLINSYVYPNPISNHSRISVELNSENALYIEIINSTGQVVLTDRFSNGSYFIGDITFSTGLYVYLIKNDTNIISYGRFVKK